MPFACLFPLHAGFLALCQDSVTFRRDNRKAIYMRCWGCQKEHRQRESTPPAGAL